MSSAYSDRDPAQAASETADKAREQGRDVAQTAAGETKQVAQDVRAQGQEVAQQAKAEAKHVADDVKGQLRSQTQEQMTKVVGSLQRLGDQVMALAQGRPQESGSLANYAEQAADRLHRAAEHVDSRGFDGIVQETQDFARRRPGAFLLAAAAAGFSAGRMLRGGAEARRQAGPAGPEPGGAPEAGIPEQRTAEHPTAAPGPVPQPTAPGSEERPTTVATYPEGTRP